MSAKQITAWGCEGCGKLFVAQRLADKCQGKHTHEENKKAEAKKQEDLSKAKKDWVRLNAESVKDLGKKIQQFMKDEYNIDLKITFSYFNFGKQSTTYRYPIGTAPASGLATPGWSGRTKVDSTISTYNPIRIGQEKIDCAYDVFREGRGLISGFHPGTGSSQEFDLCIFLADFPKIQEKYNQFKELADKQSKWRIINEELFNKAFSLLIDKDDSVNRLAQLEEFHLKMAEKAKKDCEFAIDTIKQSQVFQDAARVPDEYNYDRDQLNELTKMFS